MAIPYLSLTVSDTAIMYWALSFRLARGVKTAVVPVHITDPVTDETTELLFMRERVIVCSLMVFASISLLKVTLTVRLSGESTSPFAGFVAITLGGVESAGGSGPLRPQERVKHIRRKAAIPKACNFFITCPSESPCEIYAEHVIFIVVGVDVR